MLDSKPRDGEEGGTETAYLRILDVIMVIGVRPFVRSSTYSQKSLLELSITCRSGRNASCHRLVFKIPNGRGGDTMALQTSLGFFFIFSL